MRALLVVPPFGGLDRPSLGVHTVQACAREQGHEVDVYYGNIGFAARLGEVAYMVITTFGVLELLGERIMGLPRGARISQETVRKLNLQVRKAAEERGLTQEPLTLGTIRRAIDDWLNDAALVFRRKHYDVIGLSTTFEQTNGVALLASRCREILPEVKLVVGGANCDGAMGPAIKKLIPEIDLVFSGESELAFARYLSDMAGLSDQTVVSSAPNADLNSLPPVDYSEFFEQFDSQLPDSVLRRAGDIRISYETSRGCWWGQKHHCTFCGLNGGGIGYREKSPEKVVAELSYLVEATAIRKVDMTDNIMPYSFFGSLIPMLAKAGLGLEIFYEQKANISLEKVLTLRAAGVSRMQPGIESLNDNLLRLMKKGTSAKQNIALLRYTRAVDIFTDWNLLSGFPGDREEWYQETLDLLPLLVHLQPPTGFYTLNFDRFSPYFESPAHYGIVNLQPAASYAEAFPGCDFLDDLAYHFRGDCTGLTVEKSAVLRSLDETVEAWRRRWEREDGAVPPCLEVIAVAPDTYILVDTRGLEGTQLMQPINAEQASVSLSFHAVDSAATRWGVQNGVCLKGNGGYIPLACATPELMLEFEKNWAPDLADAPV
jgi:ribosomal peptide maturation radical SAM protein 1